VALRREITGQLNKFRAVSNEKAARTLEGSNTINVSENQKMADRLAIFLDNFDRETSYKGPISDRLNEAAKELADAPSQRKQIFGRLQSDIRSLLETIPEVQPGEMAGHAGGSGGDRGDGSGAEAGKLYRPAEGQKGFFARQ
jgi:hypothetical protein